MSVVVEAPVVESPETSRPPLRRLSSVVGTVSVIAAAAPFCVVGLVYGFTGHLVLGGDQSVIALDTFDVRHLDQLVGPYSRMGWAHPGPAWFYLMAPVFWLFGSGGPALVAASMVVEALFAALVVVAVDRGRPWQRPLMAGILLLYVLRMPSIEFVSVWNPFALLLPTMLLLLLVARACAGSVSAFAAALVVASFLVQTHVGTVPLVGLVGLVTVVALGVRLVRHPEERPSGRGWVPIGIGVGVAVLMWVPPLWQQLTAAPHQGNLANLARYFIHGDPTAGAPHTWHEAISGTGQMLGAAVYGWPAEPAELRTILTPAVYAAVGVQLLGGAVVALLARRLQSRVTGWLAALTAVACVAGLVSTKTVTGPLENYLILWISVLPAVLLYAGLSLVVAWWRSMPGRWSMRLAAVLTVSTVAGSAIIGLALDHAAETRLYGEPEAHEAAAMALAALPAPRRGDPPVLLDIRDVRTWITATEVALELEEAGHRISVEQKWEYGFGWDRLSTGNEQWRVVLVPVAPGESALPGQLGVVGGLYGPEAILLQRTDR